MRRSGAVGLLGGTVRRSSCSVIGNGVRGMSDCTSVTMPCASSRPWTTSASIGDWVRKTVTRSVMGISGRLAGRRAAIGRAHTAIRAATGSLDLHQDHRHVVVLIGAADERLDLAQDALAQLARLEVAVLLDDPAEPRVAEQVGVARSSPR